MTENQNNDELESFRRQWREEVSTRSKGSRTHPHKDLKSPTEPSSSHVSRQHDHRAPPLLSPSAADRIIDDDEETAQRLQYEEFSNDFGSLRLNDAHKKEGETRQEPQSALEHYEEAVEKETEGKLGDSLNLYRKAYRLDADVDKAYKAKHFPPSMFVKKAKPDGLQSDGKMNEKDHSGAVSQEITPMSTKELIASFASARIPPAEPLIENTPPPPCPIALVPSEVLLQILQDVAMIDPASLPNAACVCKNFAYHISYEQSIWKQLCQRHEFGFPAMHYEFECDVLGHPTYTLEPRAPVSPFADDTVQTEPLNWRRVFQTFPRIRFTGVYISTVNYTRPGAAAAANHITWNAPVHIVTYYRYLRFYRDGSCISLLTTTEPSEVVPYLWKENLKPLTTPGKGKGRNKQQQTSEASKPDFPHAPVAGSNAAETIKRALRGRWRLQRDSPDRTNSTLPTSTQRPYESAAPTQSSSSDPLTPPETDLIIETEGVDPKYTYTMQLSFRSVGRVNASNGTKNNKLVWKGFWYYNALTDDWAEFGLKNDRPFVFSRVGRYGLGY